MRIYPLIQLITVVIISVLKIFYKNSVINLSYNLNLFSASHISFDEVKTLINVYLMGSLGLNYLIFHKHIIFKIIYCLLIAQNILVIICLLKRF
jgi:hypothetical protein